jgi:hypothetical protein
LPNRICTQSRTWRIQVMSTLPYNCRSCQRVTIQRPRIVTDLLPPHVHVLECTGCGKLTIALVDIETAQNADI